MVEDVIVGDHSSSPKELANVGGTLYFQTEGPDTGYELWRSAGSAASTDMVADINSGDGDAYPALITKLGAAVYFAATDGSTGKELWRYDLP
ncbi:MAG: hypothetical protein M3198_03285 [Actinomycetota bacterium]|nr:hypothetical protein [Actinomycetota bacterium]